jgi:hypothetical protein
LSLEVPTCLEEKFLSFVGRALPWRWRQTWRDYMYSYILSWSLDNSYHKRLGDSRKRYAMKIHDRELQMSGPALWAGECSEY